MRQHITKRCLPPPASHLQKDAGKVLHVASSVRKKVPWHGIARTGCPTGPDGRGTVQTQLEEMVVTLRRYRTWLLMGSGVVQLLSAYR